jgi:hypothetical protein
METSGLVAPVLAAVEDCRLSWCMRSVWALLDSAARLIPASGSRIVLATHPGQDPPWLCMSCPWRSVTRIPHAYCMPGAYCTGEPSASLPGQRDLLSQD